MAVNRLDTPEEGIDRIVQDLAKYIKIHKRMFGNYTGTDVTKRQLIVLHLCTYFREGHEQTWKKSAQKAKGLEHARFLGVLQTKRSCSFCERSFHAVWLWVSQNVVLD